MNASSCLRLAACLAIVLAVQWQAAATQPNVIVVLCDDLGYGDIGANGGRHIATPFIDKMAREGVRLTSFYACANVCTPSRAGLLTGRYPARVGLAKGVIFPGHKAGLPPEEITVAEVLRDAGYKTAMLGKWHLGNAAPYWPTSAGFDSFYGVPYSNDMKPFPLYRDETIIEEKADQSTLTERYVAEAVKFIEAEKNKPFFLYLAHTMPHIPLFVSDRFKSKSKAGLYGDVVETIDWGMGEIFSALKRAGVDDNTLVIFTSDNGPWYEGSSGVFRNRKGASWEGGQRVPFIARWPGVLPAGATSGAISMNIDLLPTLAGLGGAALPKGRVLDGRDILSVLKGGQQSPHEYLYLFNEEKIAGVRTQRWKLVLQSFYKNFLNDFSANKKGFYHPGLLFDMEADPEELYSAAREHPEVVDQLTAWFEQGKAELSDDFVDRRNLPKKKK